jgi:hypothetical protein
MAYPEKSFMNDFLREKIIKGRIGYRRYAYAFFAQNVLHFAGHRSINFAK